ncbi:MULTISPECIES: carboxy terminal-processing peptidase [Empedobacter]|uniref:carboxy terminal-processing peptidase n=1 Tax=Empedobacter TaxID=59734 RepID=UPI0025781401|nr:MULTISPECIES: carboxy terminal-processing peptidase [Empedobacter]MDM1041061.1 carboxy terminal-processing peptidase [Empedobacter brevis]MDM1134873.1 carboxy terminal-processing peptidase [Empedobacter sp. R750]
MLDTDEEREKLIVKNTRNTLTYLHYKPATVDDKFSENVFNKYLEYIDPSKRFLLQSDYDLFKKDYHNLDDYYKSENLGFYNSTVDTIYKRIAEAEKYSMDALSKPFDFNQKENFNIDYKTSKFAKDKNEAKDLWRKYLKYNVMLEIISMQDELKGQKKDTLDNSSSIKPVKDPLADEKKKITKDTPFAEVEKMAREEVKDLISDYFRRIKQTKRENYFSIYMNSFTEQYDPHTTYFSPTSKEDFEFEMSGQMEGIGAKIQDKRGYATIAELIVGGPAWKSNKLEVGDKIIKVAQGKNGEAKNIVGMILSDAIRLIKGKKGTEVVLTIQKKDGSQQTISLIREVIESEEVFARSSIITDEKGDKYGIIYLPEFYTPMGKEGGRYPSDDIKKEIEILKKENIKGLVFDVRNNGGGSLEEVVKISGLFINQGPIVQVRRSDGMLKIHEDKDNSIAYDGPLVVMVNELSASASEIFAAAMQDYGRAVIVGSPQTFGKGTVQTILPLDRQSGSDELGAIKLTIQKFYRVNGGSTQLKGVQSDIALVDQFTYEDISEASRPEALNWDQIKPLVIAKWPSAFDLAKIKTNSKTRLANNAHLALMNESFKFIKSMEDVKEIPLNLEDYKTYRKTREDKIKKFEALDKYKNNFKFTMNQNDLATTKTDTVLKAKRNNWFKGMQKDFYLNEAVNVLRDIK